MSAPSNARPATDPTARWILVLVLVVLAVVGFVAASAPVGIALLVVAIITAFTAARASQ